MFELSPDEKSKIKEAYSELIDGLAPKTKAADKELIRKAYLFAQKAHGTERRKSGEPYIVHPINVARIVSEEIGLGTKSIVAALLHDVVEDTEYSLEDIEKEFGTQVRQIIDGLTKIIGTFDRNSTLQASTFRKLLLTIADDVRVIMIKLADRLHNMRTLYALPQVKQIKIASETLYLYAPLAHRLGLYAIKTELENLSLKYKQPDIYEDLFNRITHSEKISAYFIQKFVEPIREKLTKEKFQYEIQSRPKSIYSVWRKMQVKKIPFEQVYDILAVRIIFKPKARIPEKTQCWFIYSLITDLYQVKPDRIRDWVSQPKANGYEALHATVMGPHGRWIEVQIRSQRMDEIAERGFAAHWKYKTGENQEGELDKWVKKVSEMVKSQDSNDLEFLEDFKLNLFDAEIVTFTPKGKEITIPQGATALDFAFDIHTQIGLKAIGAKVNLKLVPLSTILSPGDQVEILTSDIQTPHLEWLDFVKTAKAKSAIKSAFKDQRKAEIEKGQARLDEILKKLNYRLNTNVLRKLFSEFEITSKEDLYHLIGQREIQLETIKKILKKRSRSKRVKFWDLQLFNFKGDLKNQPDPRFELTVKPGETAPAIKLAKCCEPIPGDKIIGYRNPNTDEITIHKEDCPKINKLISSQANNIVQATWRSHKVMAYLAHLSMNGTDRIRLVNEITQVISKDLNVNIRSMVIETRDGIFEGNFDLYVHNTHDIEDLIEKLGKIKGIESVTRLENSEE
ncbi:MAG: bifunctional (p)ppGpp synthetase/guanosine-3',5'-bis(diphosphate) 3'-pyrophosphohydrolase [Bacteroidales bacterium]|nr:bifunctional (p)ppGpp synthetase/guanosine-3',5'-bis(diphosphate) 3'-pyrophosphohydrolase [Bacteroidales bacterium]